MFRTVKWDVLEALQGAVQYLGTLHYQSGDRVSQSDIGLSYYLSLLVLYLVDFACLHSLTSPGNSHSHIHFQFSLFRVMSA